MEYHLSGIIETVYEREGNYFVSLQISFSKNHDREKGVVLEMPISLEQYTQYGDILKNDKKFISASGKLELIVKDIPPF